MGEGDRRLGIPAAVDIYIFDAAACHVFHAWISSGCAAQSTVDGLAQRPRMLGRGANDALKI